MGRQYGDEFPLEYWKRLEKMAEFMAWVSDKKGNTPNIGDQDDGRVLNLGANTKHPVTDMLAVAGIVFNRSDFISWSGGYPNEAAAWLLGGNNEKPTEVVSPRFCRSFTEGGYHVIRSGDGTDKEVVLLFDVAPNGDAVTGVHGHADALSINLHLGGQPFFSDPGTFSYQDTPLRHFFRATAQHNTLCFNDEDQSEYLNRFLWGRRETTKLLKSHMTDKNGSVTGCVQWWTGDYHERQVEYDFDTDSVVLRDRWESEKKARLNFILAPGIAVTKVGSRVCKLRGEYAEIVVESNTGHLEVGETFFSTRCYKKEKTKKIVVHLSENSGEVVTNCSWIWRN
jgi:hypothetical protein